MKAILEFDLSDLDDKEKYRLYNKSNAMRSALYELAEYIRQQYKYGEEESIKAEDLHNKFYEILGDHEIYLGNL